MFRKGTPPSSEMLDLLRRYQGEESWICLIRDLKSHYFVNRCIAFLENGLTTTFTWQNEAWYKVLKSSSEESKKTTGHLKKNQTEALFSLDGFPKSRYWVPLLSLVIESRYWVHFWVPLLRPVIESRYWVLLLSPIIEFCYWVLLLSPVIESCHWVPLLTPVIGSRYWLPLLSPVIESCY